MAIRISWFLAVQNAQDLFQGVDDAAQKGGSAGPFEPQYTGRSAVVEINGSNRARDYGDYNVLFEGREVLEEKSRTATTIKDVARMAGVSVATASYVVNETRNVRPETRHRVLTAIQRLSYSPNAAARNLAAGRSFILGLIVSDIRNPFFPEIMTGFQEAANVCSMEAVIMNTNYDAARTREAVNRLTAMQAPGVAVMTSQIDASVISLLPARGFPRSIWT